jgi:hypothetical protein
MLHDLMKELARGHDSLNSFLLRDVELSVDGLAEFDLMFYAVKDLRESRNAKKTKPVDTYLGKEEVCRTTVTYAFPSLMRWARFAGIERAVVAPHAFKEMVTVGVIPSAMLANTFDEEHAGWAALAQEDLVPLIASRAIPDADTVLQSRVGRELAANARDVKVFVLDERTLGGINFLYVAVRDGYASSPSTEVRTLFGSKIRGHFGYAPADTVAWSAGSSVVTATFKMTTIRASGIRLRGVHGDGTPSLKFRPTLLARDSGLITG